ncbi:MAG: tRNA (adenosine(37)-N6)-dimethylallyltransferase MiaA [Clostridia bacterium]|nr:tRNA (adenosine(37)-N6)-dimethylallyltransferase MiaA [Clostridia bacterium]
MEKLISVVGLTSSGKSGLGIELARFFNGEIVSADSRQVYKGLDWCSGKVTEEELKMVKHHLIDVANLGEQFTLFDFQKAAYEAIDDIISRKKVPFMVGGTGLYSRSVVEGFDLSEDKPNLELREKLEKLSKEELLKMCEEKQIEIPEEITSRRLVRALEKAESPKKENKAKYEVLQIGIDWSKEEIHERIKTRLEYRMPNMIKEIKALLEKGIDKEFLMSLGLEAKFIVRFLDGEFSSYEEFFELLFTEERHFAKRQRTWYRKEKNIIWLNGNEDFVQKAKELVEEFLKA